MSKFDIGNTGKDTGLNPENFKNSLPTNNPTQPDSKAGINWNDPQSQANVGQPELLKRLKEAQEK